jgi:hypothetical protein
MTRTMLDATPLRGMEGTSKMKVTVTKVLHAGVIAGAALMLAAMSTLPTARRAYAQDSPAVDEGQSDVAPAQNKADKASVIKFTGSGMFDAHVAMPCSADACYRLPAASQRALAG